jgi:hypothetical protein
MGSSAAEEALIRNGGPNLLAQVRETEKNPGGRKKPTNEFSHKVWFQSSTCVVGRKTNGLTYTTCLFA